MGKCGKCTLTRVSPRAWTSAESWDGGRLITSVPLKSGRRYVRYINDCYKRTGTLWEGRYKACPIDSDAYLLRCYRYIELNPLRAAMVVDPADYAWSSFRCNALGMPDPLVRVHSSYLALSNSEPQRREIYRCLVMEEIEHDELDLIRSHLQRQHAYGSNRFRTAIEAQLGRESAL